MSTQDFCRVIMRTENLNYIVLETRKIVDKIISSLDRNESSLYKSVIHVNPIYDSYYTSKLYIKLNCIVSIEINDLTEEDIEFLNKYFNPTYTE
jgi:hypothetical protein